MDRFVEGGSPRVFHSGTQGASRGGLSAGPCASRPAAGNRSLIRGATMAHSQPLTVQAQLAYEAAANSPCPDWRAVAELFRAAVAAPKQAPRAKAPAIADYNIDRIKLRCRSPRIAVRFMDGEAVFTHVPSAPGKPLNVGRALRVAIAMYRSRRTVQQRAGFRDYDRTMPVPDIFQVRCLETDELFDAYAGNTHTAAERASSNPERAAA